MNDSTGTIVWMSRRFTRRELIGAAAGVVATVGGGRSGPRRHGLAARSAASNARMLPTLTT
jgi:hypothetical protein